MLLGLFGWYISLLFRHFCDRFVERAPYEGEGKKGPGTAPNLNRKKRRPICHVYSGTEVQGPPAYMLN